MKYHHKSRQTNTNTFQVNERYVARRKLDSVGQILQSIRITKGLNTPKPKWDETRNDGCFNNLGSSIPQNRLVGLYCTPFLELAFTQWLSRAHHRLMVMRLFRMTFTKSGNKLRNPWMRNVTNDPRTPIWSLCPDAGDILMLCKAMTAPSPLLLGI